MTLSEKIIYYRRRAGLSQEQLAEKLGVSRQAVSKWETGEASPEVNKLRALADALGVTADELLSPEAPPEARQEKAASAPEGTYPAWLDGLPKAAGRLVKRFGYLAGVYVMVMGLVLALIGGIAAGVSRAMVRSYTQMSGDPFGFGGGSTIQWYDEKGNPIDAPQGWEQALLEQDPTLHGLTGSGFGGRGFINPVEIVGTVILALGALVFLFGLWLTVKLRRLSRQTAGE